MEQLAPYKPQHKVRIVTAASLFDGHDAAINIMRRIMQKTGCEVIHLGHDRSVDEVVTTAIQEDAQAIAMTSYQGGHMEYFKYMKDLLDERGAGHIRIFGGGGGTILPEEIRELHDYGIERIYHPDDGRAMGLQGMINDLIQRADFNTVPNLDALDGATTRLAQRNVRDLARCITAAENNAEAFGAAFADVKANLPVVPVLGITGTGGAGKSSMVDELVRRFLIDFPEKRIALVSVDPSKRKTGGALLGDRIRMNAIHSDRVYMRSLATRQSNLALSRHVQEALDILKAAEFDLIVLETSGIGQSDTEIMDHSDVSLYVMTPEFGAATQLEKIDMLDFADVVAINKFDKRGAQDALRDVRKQFKRNHDLWEAQDDDLPVVGTIASQFNDPGTNELYRRMMNTLADKTGAALSSNFAADQGTSEKVFIIPLPGHATSVKSPNPTGPTTGGPRSKPIWQESSKPCPPRPNWSKEMRPTPWPKEASASDWIWMPASWNGSKDGQSCAAVTNPTSTSSKCGARTSRFPPRARASPTKTSPKSPCPR